MYLLVAATLCPSYVSILLGVAFIRHKGIPHLRFSSQLCLTFRSLIHFQVLVGTWSKKNTVLSYSAEPPYDIIQPVDFRCHF